ncbi:DEAD-like helicase [Encephalitozoon hellem ATCC 50504]|uniref:SNF2 family N-terminal domain-containing protein n=1 Tax=Encephalitozoon hellem TaxID=27973 RepID=A0A9Q9CAA5_ENCHE|nr:DEAD-like helicase [Encephalitozoon hellem ATCC 50504]AFM97645.1 DEAD-like helicase [Encephalitozoon hellem ATCC 50504]UTX42334.1 Snf2/Rad54-like helicase [Encephalitozoon hellem]WEL37776.1 SNF2 family N-terminal domain-containing protein [Encephalitozoon hellem]|eukprot:XP_003886626.1 DEAD-like helicase [Encephalitozoon hellem ATCC 50504]
MGSESESTASSITTSEESSEKKVMPRKRGRPRKNEGGRPAQSHFNPMLYQAPLGYQYAPTIGPGIAHSMIPGIQHGFYNTFNFNQGYGYGYGSSVSLQGEDSRARETSGYRERSEERSVYIPERRQKRNAAMVKRTSIPESESSTEEADEESEDGIEKLLKYDAEGEKYFVKFKYKSYLHCDWVPKEEIMATKVGAMKVKKFRAVEVPFNPDFLKVDRILHEDYDGEKVFLVKWKSQPYELSTFETAESVTKCEGFEEELKKYRDRKKIRNMRVGIEWRPSRENFIKYDESPVFKGENRLREYQLEGLNWLLNRWYYRQSCIMADEMGLGKTVQSVTFINTLFTKYDYCAPVLVVTPLSIIPHWEREFEAWTDLRVLKYHENRPGRALIAEYEFVLKKNNLEIRLFDVLITTYDTVMAEQEHLSQFHFSVGIFDEAHRLKNAKSKAATVLRTLKFNHKVLLSGTPLQNNISELWSLLNFIDPVRFSSLPHFLGEFKMENINDVEKLQGLLRPLMLRRMKEDVEKSIPTKEETIIEVALTMIQKRFYRAILEKNIEFLTKGGKDSAPNLLNVMMELRKCCIHPYLIKGAEEQILSGYLKKKREKNRAEGAENDITLASDVLNGDEHQEGGIISDIDEYYKVFIQSSGKLVLLDKLLGKLKNGHKVLIFSQMTRCLDLLAEYLTYRKYKYERIDGGARTENRQAAIDRFSDKTSDVFVFLLSTRAGGVGINLTAADTVIIFDSDWNPQNDLQAQARCHRIGQTSEVKVYRLVTENTYEREMFDKAGLKLGLDRAVLQRMTFEEHKSEKTRKKDAIETLLRKGAYGVLMETDDASSRKFCEEDIDQILERRTKIVKHSDGGNVFSKASFQVEEDIDDPDFWENLLNKKKSEESEGRIKRQMRRLAREGGLTQENISEIDGLLNTKLENEDENVFYENQCLLIFLGVLRFGPRSVGLEIPKLEEEDLKGDDEARVLPQSKHFKDTATYFRYLVKYVVDQFQSTKVRSDFSDGIEEFLVDNYDPSLFSKFEDVYKKYGERFLLRIQVVMILHSLLKTEDLSVEKVRGWTNDDDRMLVELTLKYGYDCYPETIRNKNMEDMNQRVRKIVSTLSRKKEVREDNNLFHKAIMMFGRITDDNRESIVEFLGDKDIEGLEETINRILGETKRHKLSSSETECFDRMNWFNSLRSMAKIPQPKRGMLPKNWSVKTLSELRNELLTKGIALAGEKFSVSEEFIVKKFEALFPLSRSIQN